MGEEIADELQGAGKRKKQCRGSKRRVMGKRKRKGDYNKEGETGYQRK